MNKQQFGEKLGCDMEVTNVPCLPVEETPDSPASVVTHSSMEVTEDKIGRWKGNNPHQSTEREHLSLCTNDHFLIHLETLEKDKIQKSVEYKVLTILSSEV